MPKKNSKRGSKKRGPKRSHQLLLKDEKEQQEYAEVLKPLGNCMFMVKLLNGEEVVAKLKGSMTKGKSFDKVTPGNTVLTMRDGCTTGKDVYYIFHKYTSDEIRTLKQLGQLVKVVDREEEECHVMFEGDEEVKVQNEQEIDDDFINDI